MAQAFYRTSFGLSGCYMPDSVSSGVAFTRRSDLAEYIREEIETAGFPKSTFAQARIKRLWGFIKRHGASCAHFTITHGAHEIAFCGLTTSEFEEDQANDD